MRRALATCALAFATATLCSIVACGDDNERVVGGTENPGGTNGGTTNGGTTSPDGATVTKPVTDFAGDKSVQGGTALSASRTLTKDQDWHLKGIVYVPAGVTLTIEAGTTIYGDKDSSSTLVVQPGGKLEAVGTADAPIVFTSFLKEGSKAAGDWGGVILLGKAPVNGGTTKNPDGTSSVTVDAYIEGLTVTPENKYGGSEPGDSSGTLAYVRIEYSGVKLGADNEINGLTLGGVGSGTTLSHIQVRHTLDDCFEFFGGTVNADHLVCAYNQDDGFDWDNGFSGHLQFLVLQQDPKFDDEMNGFEADNNALGTDSSPISNPTISNVTLCGQNASGGGKRKFGMLLRRQTGAMIRNAVVWGFDAAVDVRDAQTHARALGTQPSGTPGLSIQNSQFFAFPFATANGDGTSVTPPADKKAEVDFGLETPWLTTAGFGNVIDVDPAFDCQNQEKPNFVPTSVITETAFAPEAPLDTTAKYVGAFKDASDTWATTGKWAAWTKTGF